MPIGQRIRTIRKQQGLSIDEVARRLGKNRTTIYRYENGDIENLPLSILDPLADALNTTPSHLMGWTNLKSSDDVDTDIGLKMKHVVMWRDAFNDQLLTEEERIKVLEYVKFIISQRDK